MLKLYNTASRRKELFRPIAEGKVGIYTCGPTLNAHVHAGLVRRLLAVDVLKRVLLREGYQVRHIVNLTDVDDKTIAESARRGVRLDELTAEHAQAFFEDVAALRMAPADQYPRATEHVTDMVDVTRRLVEAGFAYEMQRSVYFDISRLEGYGRLSGMDPGRVRTGATVDLDYYEKDAAHDFTLVRRSDLAELRRRITWSTEWGNVRPGWHVECAAMAARYLGPEFDIHTSGQDLVFPHNENENAICQALSGRPMARWWLHAGLLRRGGRKMSRSAGTAVTLRDLLARGYTGSQVRWCLLGVHYRKHMEFNDETLDAACRELARLDDLIRNLRRLSRDGCTGSSPEVDAAVEEADRGFRTALRDDLNVPRAKARLFDLARVLNARLDAGGGLTRCDAELALDFLYRADRVLCVMDFATDPELDRRVDALVEERRAAREAGDFARADALRAELAVMGVSVDDTPGGSRVRRRS
ncbi:MAG: cysteine--tRNA ligase [Deltaproteobacteria bacterium]|nr:cysteine--tRNA ligase [Deltaproteobacteria bacterium]